jgi:hypothetical protein
MPLPASYNGSQHFIPALATFCIHRRLPSPPPTLSLTAHLLFPSPSPLLASAERRVPGSEHDVKHSQTARDLSRTPHTPASQV